MATTAIYDTTQPISKKRTTGNDVPPHEDSAREQHQQAGAQQVHQTTVADNMS